MRHLYVSREARAGVYSFSASVELKVASHAAEVAPIQVARLQKSHTCSGSKLESAGVAYVDHGFMY